MSLNYNRRWLLRQRQPPWVTHHFSSHCLESLSASQCFYSAQNAALNQFPPSLWVAYRAGDPRARDPKQGVNSFLAGHQIELLRPVIPCPPHPPKEFQQATRSRTSCSLLQTNTHRNFPCYTSSFTDKTIRGHRSETHTTQQQPGGPSSRWFDARNATKPSKCAMS